MDQNDRALVDKLKAELAQQGRKTAFAEDAAPATRDTAARAAGDAAFAQVTSSSDPMANLNAQPAADGDGAASEAGFLSAMNAFRRAKATGDRDAIAAAERHLQEVVRQEMRGVEGCETSK